MTSPLWVEHGFCGGIEQRITKTKAHGKKRQNSVKEQESGEGKLFSFDLQARDDR